jgi:hypothetical protein
LDPPRYFGRRFSGRGGQIGQYMPLVDVGLCELPVHVPGCLLIGEAVT